ncbi:TetR/AcrR family transcriptional regulator [Mycolicibacterium stellerae]|uniref:TetR/AcrR family transcriptional regulator n=1 Tax=Mycolicibacterium stellerae TaxID=2358193 RepID=UPI000F0BBECB|nr:TetR/AcrR family transcriptional regulator [Mycolicibacterium stellerae]
MTPPRGTGRRLSIDDWIQAGFALVAEGGPHALRVDRLCERLGVTKGSFYWHFADLHAYRTALLDAWGSLKDQDRQRFEDSAAVEPRQRLRYMMSAVAGPAQWALERAMRVWALTDADVAANVRRSDGRVFRAVYQAFVEAGFDPEDAGVRAAVFFGAGMGVLHGATPEDAPVEMQERFLDFMFRA